MPLRVRRPTDPRRRPDRLPSPFQTPHRSLLNVPWCFALRTAIITCGFHMLDPALNVAEVTRSAASQHTSLLPMSAARMLNNYDDKMPRANLEPNSIAHGAPGVHCFQGVRASVVPDPVRRHRHRRAVVPSHGLVGEDERRRTSRGRHSALRASQGSGATIPGTERRPGQTDTRARGSNDHRPLTRHPLPTIGYQGPTPFSSFQVPQSGISDCGKINPFLPTRSRPAVEHSLATGDAQRQWLQRLPDGHQPQCPFSP